MVKVMNFPAFPAPVGLFGSSVCPQGRLRAGMQLASGAFCRQPFVHEDADRGAEGLAAEDFAFQAGECPAGGFHVEFADHVAGDLEAVLSRQVEPGADPLDFERGVDVVVRNIYDGHLHAGGVEEGDGGNEAFRKGWSCKERPHALLLQPGDSFEHAFPCFLFSGLVEQLPEPDEFLPGVLDDFRVCVLHVLCLCERVIWLGGSEWGQDGKLLDIPDS